MSTEQYAMGFGARRWGCGIGVPAWIASEPLCHHRAFKPSHVITTSDVDVCKARFLGRQYVLTPVDLAALGVARAGASVMRAMAFPADFPWVPLGASFDVQVLRLEGDHTRYPPFAVVGPTQPHAGPQAGPQAGPAASSPSLESPEPRP